MEKAGLSLSLRNMKKYEESCRLAADKHQWKLTVESICHMLSLQLDKLLIISQVE